MLAFMNRARTKRANGEDGFTLIELLVVVVILGILIAIAIPVYLNYRKSANDKAAQSDLRGAISQLEVCNSDGAYPATVNATTGAMNVCGTATDQSVKLSKDTNVLYTYTAASSSYVMLSWNTSGTSGKTYCYDSTKGGAIGSAASRTATACS